MKVPYKVIGVRFYRDNQSFNENDAAVPSLQELERIRNEYMAQLDPPRGTAQRIMPRDLVFGAGDAIAATMGSPPEIYEKVQPPKPEKGTEYYYFCRTDTQVNVGDYAIVYVNNIPKIVGVTKVKGLTRNQRGKADKVVAAIINKGFLAEWHAEQERLGEYIDLRAQLEEMKSQFDEMQVFMALAKDNPEAQELLDKMTALGAPRLENGDGKEES